MDHVNTRNEAVNLNMDFSAPVIIDTTTIAWAASPLPGVQRRRLERQNTESGHTTSIVRYAPGSSFAPHTHGGGEEYLVLDGIFSDENGDFGKGYYVRNPPGSRHTPRSREGCTIFVKLCQMMPSGEPQIAIDTNREQWQPKSDDWLIMPLYQNSRESVRLDKLRPGASTGHHSYAGGLEMLLLHGDLTINGECCQPQTWARFPAGAELTLHSANGCLFWNKRGHLSTITTR